MSITPGKVLGCWQTPKRSDIKQGVDTVDTVDTFTGIAHEAELAKTLVKASTPSTPSTHGDII